MSKKKSIAAAVGGMPAMVEAPVAAKSRAQEITQAQIAERAYSLWEARGCQGGSAEDDWHRAVQELTQEAQ